MKNLKLSMAFVAMFALLLTSCSKDEAPINSSEKASLSFATLLNDMVDNKASLKQAMGDIPQCSDATPAFVEVVLSGPENVGSLADPLVVSVNPNPGNYDGDPEAEYFTDESSELELEPGTYTLEYFAVYDGDPDDDGSNLIWIAPTSEGSLSAFVDNPLPIDISLGAGVKKYVDVEVLCFDDRMVNEYGYLFFDLETTEAIEFCIFGNFCPPSGRHFPAAYSVDVWSYSNGAQGAVIHSDLTATVALDENGDYAASPICMALPDTDGEDQYWVEITLLSSDPYGDVTESVIRQGVLTDDMVRSLFDGEDRLDYYHFREGCEGDDGPPIFEDPTSDAETYMSCLCEVGNSDATGYSFMVLEDNTLTAHVYAFGVEPNREHPQHIHALADNANSTCENPGPPIVSLTEESGDFPMASATGSYEYHRTFTLGADGIVSKEDLGDLELKTLNVHGRMIDGEYVAGDVVACGQITQVSE